MTESYAKRLAHYEESAQQKQSQGVATPTAVSGAAPTSPQSPGPPQP
jgi:hypothetical protein